MRTIDSGRMPGGALPHNMIVEGRERLNVSGVEDVERFDEGEVVLYTTRGRLTITGGDFHMERLSLEQGELALEGRIDCMEYSDGPAEKVGFWARLFG